VRKTKEELDLLMKQENADRIWSWSRINSFHTSPYEYMLKYIKHIPEDRQDCIYTTTGSIAHDILEKFYTNQIEYTDMINQFEDAWLVAYDIGKLKFDRNDEEKNKKIGDKYYENLKNFFNNHTIIKNKPLIEQFVKFKIGDNLFTGYIDCCFKDDDGNYNIIDFKTSSIYKGEKAENECGQLVCYAISLNQMGVPMDKVRIAWNFLKYVSIQYQQKNGTIKTREVERCKIGESLQTNAKMWLKEYGYANQADDYLKMMLDTNSIEVLPEDVQKMYVISDCYVYVPLTQKLIDTWTNTITLAIQNIKLREKDYEETKSDKCWWDSEENVKAQSYYFSTLCAYSPNLHLPYKEYLDKLESSKNGNDLFGGVGSNTNDVVFHSSNVKTSTSADLSWLDNII
jgi:hypothetical protein